MAETAKKIENEKTKKERVFTNCNAILWKIKNLGDRKWRIKKPFIETTGVADSMIVNDKTTFKDSFVDNEFHSSNVKISQQGLFWQKMTMIMMEITTM